jgi:hypothetical protein
MDGVCGRGLFSGCLCFIRLSLAFVRRPSKYGIENICPPSLLPDRNDSQRPST